MALLLTIYLVCTNPALSHRVFWPWDRGAGDGTCHISYYDPNWGHDIVPTFHPQRRAVRRRCP